jgi:DnaJ-class molecular chaperone
VTYDHWKSTEPDMIETVTCPRCHGEETEPRLASRPCRQCFGQGVVRDPLSEEEMDQLEMDVDVNEQIELHLLGEPRDGEASG